MLNRLTPKDRAYLARVKACPCSVCGAPGISEAHHIRQGVQRLAVALCADCHRGYNGWHGTKAYWRIRKMDELDALAVTLKNLEGVN